MTKATGSSELVEQIADSPGAGHLSESEGLKQLGLLYNYREDDSRQFTRWQMLLAMNHGFGFAADHIANLEARLARAEELRAEHLIVGRLLDAIDRVEQDIGGETPLAVIRELGPAHDRARAALAEGEGQ